jgi:asparagine synthase (glutamine-hydrolysing)
MYVQKLATMLEEVVSEHAKEKIDIAFSGGLDSSLLAYLLSKHTNVTLYTVGSHNSHDLKSAHHSANLLGLPLQPIEIDENNIENAIKELLQIIGWLGEKTSVVISFELPLFFVFKHAKENFIVLGQGSDELFLGYHKFKKFDINEVSEMEKEVFNELLEEVKREEKIANYFNKKMILPYLDEKIVNFVHSIPIEERFDKNMEKILLRKVAKELGLPKEIYEKRKKAAQYGSGTMKIIRKLAKKRGMDVKGYIELHERSVS